VLFDGQEIPQCFGQQKLGVAVVQALQMRPFGDVAILVGEQSRLREVVPLAVPLAVVGAVAVLVSLPLLLLLGLLEEQLCWGCSSKSTD